ncbi:DUF2520 domain-containing protein [Mucilaginibacter sp. Bleaf8]|uniref:Rossmann-like and DUF2520 domain-containing protein n=1 Tax=Mucilaginibacter sp. Bleaf8 TaxID=2834430 RepID=UPI001BD01E3D|nr:DUF2520 domain-containing protein [Mucilaginibacter sp. Bleaf8]MBS7563373.1 DUF2520 domain-containing protein [Mucilaginibacter sp. Bleaf8]
MKIIFIGSGNVATHLATAFKQAGHQIKQVYSLNHHNAELLAKQVEAEAINNLQQITDDADIFIISIKDDAIESVAAELAIRKKLIVHTSGATPLQTILKYTAQAGVFYPLQTFSKAKEVDFKNVPLCIEGANAEITEQLIELAQSISDKVFHVSSDQRKVLHLSAVFACNFPNYLYYVAQQLLAQHNLDFDLVRPLIMETAEKVQEQLPQAVQTGPAIRNDVKTMDAHLALLGNNTALVQLYEMLSQAIIKMGADGHSFE